MEVSPEPAALPRVRLRHLRRPGRRRPGPAAAPAPAPKPDPWALLRFLEGEWQGAAEGEPGVGTVHRSYQFVLQHRFLEERNVSAYAPKTAGAAGELHEHRSLFSYDRKRKLLVLRQLHQEGFVNQYAFVPEASTPAKLVFVTEAPREPRRQLARAKTYEVRSPNEFVETFELAEPGKDFAPYSPHHLQRVRSPAQALSER